MTELLPIGRQILIDKRDYQPRFMHVELGVINPLHQTRQKFLEQFKNNVFPPSMPPKNKQCDLDLIGHKTKIHKDDPNQIFQEFNLKDILPQHIARPYIYIQKVNKRITPKERGTMKGEELEKYNYSHNGEWNKSTNLYSLKNVKNSNKENSNLPKNAESISKEEREEFYEASQKQTKYIFEFYKLLKHLLLKNGKTKSDLKSSVHEFIKKNKKLVDSDQFYFTKQEIYELISSFSNQIDHDKINFILDNFFSSVHNPKLSPNKISMRALVYNFNRYYENKQKIEQKFSLAKAKKLNAQIHYDACYWTFNYKILISNLKQMEDKEKQALEKINSLYGEKYYQQFKKLIDDRNKKMKTRAILAKFFKNSLQIKQILDIEIIAKAFIQKILSKSQEIALFQEFISSYFQENEKRKSQEILKKEELAEYLINRQYPKEDADVIISKIVGLYKYAQEEKIENTNVLVQQVEKEIFVEFLKINLKKQDSKMSVFIKMMNDIQLYFEREVEIREIKEKSVKKYEMNMIANFILRYLQTIERKFLKCQWKIMSVLKAFEDNTISQSKLEGILNSHGIPSSFTLKFLFSSQVYQKKSNFLCQERQLAHWKIDLQKALGIYMEEIQRMKNFFDEMGNAYQEELNEEEDEKEETFLSQNIIKEDQPQKNDSQKAGLKNLSIDEGIQYNVQPQKSRNTIHSEQLIEQPQENAGTKKRISFAQLPNGKGVNSKRSSIKSLPQGIKEGEEYEETYSEFSTDVDYLSMCESLISVIKVENALV